MKIKVREALSMLLTLSELAHEKLPFGRAFEVASLVEELQKVEVQYAKRVEELYNEYAEKDATGGYASRWNSAAGQQEVVLKEGAEEAFQKAGNEILKEEINVDLPVLHMEDWENLELNLTPTGVMSIRTLFQ